MIAGSSGRPPTLPVIMEMARAPGPRARRLGRERRLWFQGPTAWQSLTRSVPMVHRAGELRAGPAACGADDAVGWPGFDGNEVVVTTMSSSARRCDNDVVERPSAAVAGGDRTGRRGESGGNGRCLYPLLARASRLGGLSTR